MKFSEQAIVEGVREIVEAEQGKPFKVAVMGQTGTGKSSLINALFRTDLKTDAVRPCTTEIEGPIEVKNGQGHRMWFYDLPGVGESSEADVRYLKMYLAMLREADLVLWLLHADNRSVAFDAAALGQVFALCDAGDRATVINKVTVVLSKADLLTPPAWVCAVEGESCTFAPQEATQRILDAKGEYVAEALLRQFGDDLRSSTFLDEPWKFKDGRFVVERDEITFLGHLTDRTVAELKEAYPKGSPVLDRLRDNHRAIPCSSLFRFNLYQLLSVVVNKLGGDATLRFKNFFDPIALNKLTRTEAMGLGNILVVDPLKNKVIFDLSKYHV